MPSIPILFGTETGNAEYSAKELKSALDKAGYPASVIDMSQFGADELGRTPLVLIVTSTYGKGDPPVNAEKLLKHLQKDSPLLTSLRYGVCALGDSTYQDFAQCGRDFDRLLAERGARRVIELCVCDVEFEEYFPTFKQNVLAWLQTTGEEFRGVVEAPAPKKGFFKKLAGLFGGDSDAKVSEVVARASPGGTVGNEHSPVQAQVLRRRRLNGPGSVKETMHYELSLEGTGLSYEPGDSIAVHPLNSTDDVARFVSAFSLDANEIVELEGRSLPVSKALLTRDFQRMTSGMAELLARAKGPLGTPHVDPKEYRQKRHLLEALKEHVWEFGPLEAHTVLAALLPIPPRLYSVASSQLVTPNEVHLTVETPRYEHDGFGRVGLASGYLCDRVADGHRISIHKVAGPHFRVASSNVDMIMVGPGTGVAPFRAFLLERRMTGATGRNWLFFGHQHRGTDFLYEEELQGFVKNGLLTRLDCAWSRDQAEKRYVQHLMVENGQEIWDWLSGGAVFYVCGDKTNMAAGVHEALVSIAARCGNLADADARSWVNDLATAQRYRLDVY